MKTHYCWPFGHDNLLSPTPEIKAFVERCGSVPVDGHVKKIGEHLYAALEFNVPIALHYKTYMPGHTINHLVRDLKKVKAHTIKPEIDIVIIDCEKTGITTKQCIAAYKRIKYYLGDSVKVVWYGTTRQPANNKSGWVVSPWHYYLSVTKYADAHMCQLYQVDDLTRTKQTCREAVGPTIGYMPWIALGQGCSTTGNGAIGPYKENDYDINKSEALGYMLNNFRAWVSGDLRSIPEPDAVVIYLAGSKMTPVWWKHWHAYLKGATK